MPLLHAEPDIFPPTLLDVADSPQGEWWVLYTLARKEKQLCRLLLAQQLSFFCPTVDRRYRSPGGRARISHLPLFPNYVFLHGNNEVRYQSVTTGCVSRCLSVAEPDRFVHDLQQIKRLIECGVPLTPEDKLRPGMLVRVKNGPLRGLDGRILENRSGRRLLVAVNFIQRGASVELGDWELEPLD